MSIKLIAIDLDGTLLNNQKKISTATKQAIVRALEKDIAIVLATGRPFIGMRYALNQLDLRREGQFCISNNGALIHRNVEGECIAETTLGNEDYRYFEALSRELDVHFHAFSKQNLYTANKDISRFSVRESSLTEIPLHYCAVEEMDKGIRFPKLMMIDEQAVLNAAIDQLPAQLYDQYTIIKSTPNFLEILDKRVNKGAALRNVAERLNIPREQIMAIGDEENDIAMLQYAGCGVAMGNAISPLKNMAQFVTKTNEEDGVACAIEQLAL